MRVLGIHAFEHDSAACLYDGTGPVAIAEERLSRVKHDGGFPRRAISYVLAGKGIESVLGVDLIVLDRMGTADGIAKAMSELKDMDYRGEIETVDHHDAHAASAFFAGPFEESAVMVVDSFGSWGRHNSNTSHLYAVGDLIREVQSLYRGAGNTLTLVRRTFATQSHPFGIGLLYAWASLFLGFGEFGSGKVMALAAYGGKHPIRREPFLQDYQGDWVGPGDLDPASPANAEEYGRRIFPGLARSVNGSGPLQAHAEAAHFVQQETERAVLGLSTRLHTITKLDSLCCAGGVALNCPSNTRLVQETGFQSLFVQPAADDSGIALGCALYGYHVLGKQPRSWRQEDAFLGREYSQEEISQALAAYAGREEVREPEDLEKETASHLAQGKIVGWFQGRSEIGPRALGSRSLLADPRYNAAKRRLDQLKRRESFRPYAPAVQAEEASKYFSAPSDCPYMLHTPKVREEFRSQIPAAVHVDGTARVQAVNAASSPRFHRLLGEFGRVTGIPMVINTSFNRAGEPIVETPGDALRMFGETEIDVLVLGDRLVTREA